MRAICAGELHNCTTERRLTSSAAKSMGMSEERLSGIRTGVGLISRDHPRKYGGLVGVNVQRFNEDEGA